MGCIWMNLWACLHVYRECRGWDMDGLNLYWTSSDLPQASVSQVYPSLNPFPMILTNTIMVSYRSKTGKVEDA